MAIPRPPLALLGLEPLRAGYELPSHAFTRNAPAVQADSHPVIIFPGMAASGLALAPSRRHCDRLGHAATDWRRGFNTGLQAKLDDWLAELAAQTTDMLAPCDQSAMRIAWSLGGLYARELAERLGQRVRQVTTLGTPFNAGADHTRVGWMYWMLSDAAPAFN